MSIRPEAAIAGAGRAAVLVALATLLAGLWHQTAGSSRLVVRRFWHSSRERARAGSPFGAAKPRPNRRRDCEDGAPRRGGAVQEIACAPSSSVAPSRPRLHCFTLHTRATREQREQRRRSTFTLFVTHGPPHCSPHHSLLWPLGRQDGALFSGQ